MLKKNFFFPQMLAKKARAQQASTFRPIANILLLYNYKIFAFVILVRMEASLEHISRKKNTGSENTGGWNSRLLVNGAKTVVLTSKVQPLSYLHTNNGVKLRVLKKEEPHKWLGCMIFFFSSLLFNREKVQRYRAVLLGSLQAQTVFILASLQMCWW